MPATEERPLVVEINGKGCDIPTDERDRLGLRLDEVRRAVAGRGPAQLGINAVRYPRSGDYHAEAKLRWQGPTLFSGGRGQHLDTALQACMDGLLRELSAAGPAAGGDGRAELDRDVVAPQGAGAGPAGEAFRAGDYARFRTALLTYEDWLRKRIGRWVQRYPEAEARLGRDILIGDLLEEVYLAAFEAFDRHPRDVPLHTWLDGLIDPALQRAMRHPDDVRQEASLARTLREVPG
jgi:hypothetical protein